MQCLKDMTLPWILDFPLFSYFQTSLNITELPDTIKPYLDSSPARRVIPFFYLYPSPYGRENPRVSN